MKAYNFKITSNGEARVLVFSNRRDDAINKIQKQLDSGYISEDDTTKFIGVDTYNFGKITWVESEEDAIDLGNV